MTTAEAYSIISKLKVITYNKALVNQELNITESKITIIFCLTNDFCMYFSIGLKISHENHTAYNKIKNIIRNLSLKNYAMQTNYC